MATTRAAIYCRISKDKDKGREGAGLSAQRQGDDCRALAEQLGWSVVEVFTDNDISAYSGKPRPRYKRMLAAIREGRVDAVLAWHTDRLHRSPAELEDYISACEPRSVPTHCVKAGHLDLSTASGRMTARVSGAVARHEVEHMSERIRAQKQRSRDNSEWIGSSRPFGYSYVFDREQPPRKVLRIELDETEAEIVRDGVRRTLAGESTYALTKRWQGTVPTPRGGSWTAATIKRVLTRELNAGGLTHNGAPIPAIVDADEHRAVCSILNDPKRTTYSGTRSLKWVGSGLYRCGVCGMDMRPASASDRTGTKRRIYRCRSAKHVNINADTLDTFVMDAACRKLDDGGAKLLSNPDSESTKELHDQANTLRARLGELADMLGDGELSRHDYGRQRERVQTRLDTVHQELASHASGSVLDGVANATKPSEAFLAQPVARQRAIIDALMTITIRKAKPGRLPRGVDFDYGRIVIDPKSTTA